MSDRDIMDREAVAEYLGVSPDTVDTLDLPSHIVGWNLRRYVRDEVKAWVLRQPQRKMQTI